MAYTPEQRQTALRAFSVPSAAIPKQKDGTVPDADRWERLELRIAEALFRDADLLWYFVFLASNRTRQQFTTYAALLEEVLACWEGHLYAPSKRPLVETGAEGQLARLKEVTAVGDKIEGATPATVQVARTVAALRAHVYQNLVPHARGGTSVRLHAPEARTRIGDLRSSVLAARQNAAEAARRLPTLPDYDAETIRRDAARPTIEAATFPTPDATHASTQLLDAASTIVALERFSIAYAPQASPFAAAWAATLAQLGTITVPDAGEYLQVPEAAAYLREGMQRIAEVAASLAPLSAETQARLQRIGATVPTRTAASVYLDAYAPAFSTTTKQAGRALLDACRAQKFDLAEEALLTAQIRTITTRSMESARRTEALTTLVQGVE